MSWFKKSLQFGGKVKKLDFNSGSNSATLEILSHNAQFKLVAENQEATALLYATLLSHFYDESKNKGKIIRDDKVTGETSQRGVRSMKSRHVDVDAAFEIVFYDVP